MKKKKQTVKVKAQEESSVLNLTLSEFTEQCKKLGLPGFTAKQVFDWVYQKSLVSFTAMRNLSKTTQATLADKFTILPFKSIQKLPSPDGTAIKYLFDLGDCLTVEAVVLKEKGYDTLCISSQCGCPVDCKFCLTGVAGLKKQLSTGEILGQLLAVRQDGHNVTHLVFMGMGEPLLNYDSVTKALHLFTDQSAFGMSMRKITVSTAGYLPGIERLIEDKLDLNLAFSVGHPNPVKRVQIMPLEKRHSIIDVSRTLHSYLKQHNRKLTLEYTLLEGVNDDKEACLELGNLAKYLNAKVNLINLNPHPRIPFKPITSQALKAFKNSLRAQGVPATIRFTKGQEVTAACGQLGESIL